MKVEFDFDLEERVRTKFEDYGFIEDMSVNRDGKKYWVQTSTDKGRWFRAEELTKPKDIQNEQVEIEKRPKAFDVISGANS